MGDDRQKARALDAYLVAAARAGDHAALGRLVHHRGPRLLAHARRLVDDSDTARDVVQEAWVEILRALPGLRDDAAFLPWALCIVSRRASAEVRRRVQGRRLVADWAADRHEDPVMPDPPGPGSDCLAQAVASLPPDQRVTLALFYHQDLSLAEVAQALGIPVGTVKTRLFHARARLRAALQENDHEPT